MKTSSPQVILCSSFASLALLAVAQEPDAASKGDSAPAKMDEIVVTGKRSDLLGIAPSASEGTASGEELRARPLMRRGEALETVPGMVVTQHAGGGRPTSTSCGGLISIMERTSPSPSTGCRSTCAPTRTGRATPT